MREEGKTLRKSRRWFALVGASALVAALTVVVAVGGASARTTAKAANPYNLNDPTTLVVGMNLQYKPEMYLDAKGKPAGYDVVLVTALAKAMGVKLKIQNLDFNGLIPGLVAKKFDMVSVGLTPTPERKKAVSFSR
jgi:ABC-type amino acid transport substrate-binding protein